jgi:hypothetical protein
MQMVLRLSALLLMPAWLAITAGCETAPPRTSLEWKAVPITNPAQAAGKWEGILRRVPPSKTDDLVAILIATDGRFRFTSVRTIGVLSGEGTFTVADHRLTVSTEQGSIDMTLYEADGRRMLKTKARSHDGFEYFSDLTPAGAR